MSYENNERKKRVARQFWRPNSALTILHGIWIGAYSVLKIFVGAVATVASIALVCAFVFIGILATYLENDIIPMADTNLENYSLDQTSYAYYLNANGDIETLQKIYATTNREWASIEEIPEDLIHATVAIEDKRFYEHQGVDWFTTIKACMNMFLGGNSQFGGSSITQQLIKNLTGDDSVTVQRKVLEIFKATEFERRYDKNVVLEWYLNTIYLGNRRYGVKAASAIYFGKELENLTAAECASLIAITNNPSLYNPYRESLDKGGKTGYERNMVRKEDTLDEMYAQGWLTEEEHKAAMEQEIVLKWGISDADRVADCFNEDCGYHSTVSTFIKGADGKYTCPKCGAPTVIDEDASLNVYSWFVDTVLEDVAKAFAERDGAEWNEKTREIYMEIVGRGGYHIYTTLDMKVQQAIDRIYTNLDEIPEARSVQQLQSGIVVIDNRTGDIVGMAGGVGEKADFDAFNRATEAMLQPGSCMKPLSVYGPAFELGLITPGSIITDLPLYYNDDDKPFPKNAHLAYGHRLSVRQAVAWSLNTVAINLLDTIGTNYSYDFVKNTLHLSTLTDHYVNSNGQIFSDINYSPLGLGAPTVGVSIRELTNAYATFACDGIYRNARTFTKVYDSEGNLVIDNQQTSEKVFNDKAVDYMSSCMEWTTIGGTGTDGAFSGQQIASKTGTTDDTKDRWFCGFTGHYTASVWCGYDQPETITLIGDQSNPAARLWKKVMEPIHKGLPSVDLYDQSKMHELWICIDCGKVAHDVCSKDVRTHTHGNNRVEKVYVYEEDIPVEVCDCHIEVDYCTTCNAVANEYCKKFAKEGMCKIVKRSLVKLTAEDLMGLRDASEHGLYPEYQLDNWIYFVKDNGRPGTFIGINGDANKGINAPYLVGTKHTKKMWESYLDGDYDPNEEDDKENNKEDSDSTDSTDSTESTEDPDIQDWMTGPVGEE